MRITLALAAAAAAFSLCAGPASAQEKVKCPVSKAEFVPTEKNPVAYVNGQKITFCCNNCPKAFAGEPEKFVSATDLKCPLTSRPAKVSKETRILLNNNLYYTCCTNCHAKMAADPAKFVKEVVDPVTGKAFAITAESPRVTNGGRVYIFASPDSKTSFEKETTKYIVIYK